VVVLEDAGWAPLRQTLRIYIVTAAPPADTDHLDLGGVFIYIDGPGKEHLDPLHGLVLPGSLIRSLTRGQFGVFGCEIPVLPALARRPALGSLQSAAGTQPLQAVDDPGADVHRCFMDGQKRRVMAIIIRTAAKLIAARQGVKAVERSGSDEERAEREALADGLWLLLSGLITVSEQADTRCWSQLPGRVGAACVDLPVGTHTLTLRHASGAISTLGPIQVLPGRTIVVTTRSFPDGTAVPESRR
jgi:hypothetical protein